tara:strand:- start:2421 stop:2528 length:108 start_codon:yes stop_codon:yes gene_type:complete
MLKESASQQYLYLNIFLPFLFGSGCEKLEILEINS